MGQMKGMQNAADEFLAGPPEIWSFMLTIAPFSPSLILSLFLSEFQIAGNWKMCHAPGTTAAAAAAAAVTAAAAAVIGDC